MELRLAELADAAQVRDIYAPSCFTPISFEEGPPSVEEMQRRMAAILETMPWLVCANDRLVIGYAYAGPHRQRAGYRWSTEVSAYIREGHRGLGIGRALYTCLLDLVRLQGFYNAYAGITLPNPASVRLHEAMGFQPVGIYRDVGYKCGQWHDVGWWQLCLQPLTATPTPPKPLAAVRDSAGWQEAFRNGMSTLDNRSHPVRSPLGHVRR